MDKIKAILEEIRPEFNFNDSSDFIEDGLLDSFDIVSLVSMLEETFHISIDGLDIMPENFNSFTAIAQVVGKSGGAL